MKIQYLAWPEDKFGISEEGVTIPSEVTDVGTFINWLSTRNPRSADAFEFPEVIKVMVNRGDARNANPVKQEGAVFLIPLIVGG